MEHIFKDENYCTLVNDILNNNVIKNKIRIRGKEII